MNLLLPALYKCQDLEAATPRRKEPTSPRISASTHGPLQGEPGTRSTHKESPRAAAAPPQQGPERQRTRVQPRAGKAPHPPAGSPGRRAEARGPVHLCCQKDPRAKALRTLSAWCPDRRSAMSFLTRGRRPPWGHLAAAAYCAGGPHPCSHGCRRTEIHRRVVSQTTGPDPRESVRESRVGLQSQTPA